MSGNTLPIDFKIITDENQNKVDLVIPENYTKEVEVTVKSVQSIDRKTLAVSLSMKKWVKSKILLSRSQCS